MRVENIQGAQATCLVCDGSLGVLALPFPCFRHKDFSTISKILSGKICSSCGTVQSLDAFTQEKEHYRSKAYALSQQTKCQNTTRRNPIRPRYEIQARHIDSLLDKDAESCLDIGCMEGALLRELGRRRENLNLSGLEVNEFVRRPGQDSRLYITNIEAEIFEGIYDAVIYSHSIMYIPNIKKQLIGLKNSLSNNGFVYVQIPDLTANPFYCLMGDQAYIFTPESLVMLLESAGYSCETQKLKEFSKEVIVLAYPSKQEMSVDSKPCVLEEGNRHEFSRFLHILQEFNAAIGAALTGSQVYVFGTTVNAAFVHEMYPDRVIGFVDENMAQSTFTFRNLPVRHPSDLLKHEVIFFPPGISKTIVDRVEGQYLCSKITI